MGVALKETFSLLFHGFTPFHTYCLQVLNALYNVKKPSPFQVITKNHFIVPYGSVKL